MVFLHNLCHVGKTPIYFEVTFFSAEYILPYWNHKPIDEVSVIIFDDFFFEVFVPSWNNGIVILVIENDQLILRVFVVVLDLILGFLRQIKS